MIKKKDSVKFFTQRKARNLLSKTIKFLNETSSLFETNPVTSKEIILICHTLQKFVKTTKYYGFGGSFYDPNVLQKIFAFLERKLDILPDSQIIK